MLPVSKLPPGLLSFFGIKNGGRYPQWEDSPTYINALDMLDWLLADDVGAVTATGVVAGAAIGTLYSPAALTVPNGQTWIVTNVSVNASPGAGQTLQCVLGCSIPGPNTTIADFLGPPGNVATTGQMAVATRYNPWKPFYARPGTIIGSYITQIAAGPINLQISARYVPLTI